MFDRTEHCRRIAAHGGNTTYQRHGVHHMRIIGKAGARATIRKHGVPYFQGMVARKGWTGPKTRPSLTADLAAGRELARLAAGLLLTLTVGITGASAQHIHHDPSLAPLMAAQAARFPAPAGCAVVGVWEDGSIVAYCDDGHRPGLDAADTWLSHGPDAGDNWHAYTGPLAARWLQRAALN